MIHRAIGVANMFRPNLSRSLARLQTARARLSTKAPSALESDSGALATRVHHGMTTSLAVLTPVFFMVPDSMTDGKLNKLFGLFLSTNIAAHSWIGLNYVATDYVPKVSKALLGPARIVNAGLAAITLLGLYKISLMSEGGLKGVVKGVWNGKRKDDFEF